MADKLLLTMQEVVEMLGVSENMVRKLCKHGHIKGPYKIGGEKVTKFQRKHIDQYLDDMERDRLPPIPKEEEIDEN